MVAADGRDILTSPVQWNTNDNRKTLTRKKEDIMATLMRREQPQGTLSIRGPGVSLRRHKGGPVIKMQRTESPEGSPEYRIFNRGQMPLKRPPSYEQIGRGNLTDPQLSSLQNLESTGREVGRGMIYNDDTYAFATNRPALSPRRMVPNIYGDQTEVAGRPEQTTMGGRPAFEAAKARHDEQQTRFRGDTGPGRQQATLQRYLNTTGLKGPTPIGKRADALKRAEAQDALVREGMASQERIAEIQRPTLQAPTRHKLTVKRDEAGNVIEEDILTDDYGQEMAPEQEGYSPEQQAAIDDFIGYWHSKRDDKVAGWQAGRFKGSDKDTEAELRRRWKNVGGTMQNAPWLDPRARTEDYRFPQLPVLKKPAPEKGKPLDQATAQKLFDEVGGNRAEAEKLARARGYNF